MAAVLASDPTRAKESESAESGNGEETGLETDHAGRRGLSRPRQAERQRAGKTQLRLVASTDQPPTSLVVSLEVRCGVMSAA